MASSGIGQNQSVGVHQPPGSMGRASRSREAATSQVFFGSGRRSVRSQESTLSYKRVEGAKVDDKPLSERSVDDVGTKEKGYLRKGLDQMKTQAGKAWSGTKSMAKGAAFGVRHPMKASREVGAYARGKGASLQKGVKAFRQAPRETTAKGFRSLKGRAISLAGVIKTKLPPRPESTKLPAIKFQFSRLANRVPSTPSGPIKAKMERVSQVQKKGVEATRLEGARENLMDAKERLTNAKNLGKLLDDPNSFFKNGKDVTVKWGHSKEIHIRGEGLDRAKNIRAAVGLAVKNHQEIRAELQRAKGEIDKLKSEVSTQKTKVREQVKTTHKQISQEQKREYETHLKPLKENRENLKKELHQAQKALGDNRSKHKDNVKNERDSIKAQIKAEKLYVKELEQSIKGADEKCGRDIEELDKQLKTCESTILKHVRQLQKNRGKGDAFVVARRSFDAACQKADELMWEIENKQFDLENAQAIRENAISVQKNKIGFYESKLNRLSKQVTGEHLLEQRVQDAKAALDENSHQIDALREQYWIDRHAIKKAR